MVPGRSPTLASSAVTVARSFARVSSRVLSSFDASFLLRLASADDDDDDDDDEEDEDEDEERRLLRRRFFSRESERPRRLRLSLSRSLSRPPPLRRSLLRDLDAPRFPSPSTFFDLVRARLRDDSLSRPSRSSPSRPRLRLRRLLRSLSSPRVSPMTKPEPRPRRAPSAALGSGSSGTRTRKLAGEPLRVGPPRPRAD